LHIKKFGIKIVIQKNVLNLQRMKNLLQTFIFLFFVFSFTAVYAHEESGVPEEGIRMRAQVIGNDTILVANLREVTIFAPLVFRNRQEERFYWRTVRDVKRTLPLARLVASEVIATNQHLLTLPNDRARREYLDEFERELFRRYESELRRLTLSQGRMLIKLIERECDKTAHDLIRVYRGRVSAGFWQGFARVFGANLKSTIDPNTNEGRIIERVILLVESGQL